MSQDGHEEFQGERQGKKRLHRTHRVDADRFWREGFDQDQLKTMVRHKDRFEGRQKVSVEKLPDVVGEGRNGIVTSVSRRSLQVEMTGGEILDAGYSPRLALGRESLVAVGDNVVIHAQPGSGWILTSVEERRTKLSRPGPDARDHLDFVIAANIDLLVIVASCDRPRFHPRFIDRFHIAAQLGGVEPVLFLNKCDLMEPALWPDLSAWEGLGMTVVRGSAETGEGLEELERLMSGKLGAMAGHSGVGKTSLLNRLLPDLNAVIGEVRSKDGRGRHTTTRSHLHTIPGGGRLIDTPGIRELGMQRLTAQELSWYFPEFDPYLGKCRFNDCRHKSEPDCAVRAAVEEGVVHEGRFSSYLRILESLEAGR